jgi:hypothetical protein
MLLNTSEFACKREDSGSGKTSADIITINVRPLMTKLHFIIIYFVTDSLTAYWQLSVFLQSPNVILPRRNVCLEAFAATEFNANFLGRQPHQDVKVFWPFGK